MTLRKVEVFTAGCRFCDDAVQLVRDLAGPGCAVEVLDMKDEATREKARTYGIMRVPAVLVGGVLAECCQTEAVSAASLRALGVGRPS